MRRRDREITDPADIADILDRGMVCRLGLCRDGEPYVVPICYGYSGNSLYYHCAPEGLKLEILKANPGACFEITVDVRLRPAEKAAAWTMDYRSVIGRGQLNVVTDPSEKRRGIGILMEHYSGRTGWAVEEEMLRRTTILRLDIDEITGKASWNGE